MTELERFRAEHPYRRATIQGVQWEYIACGQGERAILLLPGALATGESTWITLPHFESRFRVIAPSYPPVPTMTELVDGLAEILTREGIDRAVVSGGSYGGLVAQAFVRRHPQKTERLILSHTTVLAAADARRLGTAVRLLRFLPERLVLAMFRGKIAGLVPELPETALFRAYVREAVAGMTKAGLLALYARVADMRGGAGFTPQDLDGWPGRVLLVYADNDPATPQAAQRKLAELYPQAKVHVFSGTGHATALLQPEKYLGLLDRFIG